MQFHRDGFRTGDPHVAEASPAAERASRRAEVDVLIVGCGPAGLTLAAQLSAFPDIAVRIVEQKDGPLKLGQADGVACRTMEMFQAFGFADRALKEAYWVNETSFWRPSPENPAEIVRSGRIDDTEPGLSEFPHVILNQARVHEFYLEIMRNSPSRLEPDYSRRLVGLTVDRDAAHPVEVRLERTDAGHESEVETIRARYVIGCDGARSAVRKAIGRELKGDSANQAWGVMDVLALTDFPDIRLKALVKSAEDGSIVLIPREGGHLARFYIELDALQEGERVRGRAIDADDLIAAANRILRPYRLDVRQVAWWSVYEIGQRLTDRFDDVAGGSDEIPHVFIAGDACHTHSPKAGQGMNVSMQDAFNLGWKLAAVLRGQCAPSLLGSYSDERQAIAKELIDFDRDWAKMLSAPIRDSNDPSSEGVDPAEVQAYFQRSGRYTAGTATRYAPSMLTAEPQHQTLATGLPVGMRFHSAPVIRLADAKPMQLGHAGGADGRWRIYLFADGADPMTEGAPVRALCDFLAGNPQSPLARFTPAGAGIDSVIDVRAVFRQPHRELDINRMPPLLLPSTGKLGLRDYEKMFCVDPSADIYALRGIDPARGAVVVVRPDQYVANVLPLDAHAELAGFFAGFMLPRS